MQILVSTNGPLLRLRPHPDQLPVVEARSKGLMTGAQRVITDGVIPSVHVDYKHSRIKQYFKQGVALRTETTINDTRDFGIGRRLPNLPALREIGFPANRRLLEVQRISSDPIAGAATYNRICQPIMIGDQRVPALRFDAPATQALLTALVMCRLLPTGFANCDLRALLAPLLGVDPETMTPGRMTYHLRRLRLHGLIERIPHTTATPSPTSASPPQCSSPGPTPGSAAADSTSPATTRRAIQPRPPARPAGNPFRPGGLNVADSTRTQRTRPERPTRPPKT